MKDGVQTSEFMGAAVAAAASILSALAAESDTIKVASLGCLTIIVCAYIWSRTRVKSGR